MLIKLVISFDVHWFLDSFYRISYIGAQNVFSDVFAVLFEEGVLLLIVLKVVLTVVLLQSFHGKVICVVVAFVVEVYLFVLVFVFMTIFYEFTYFESLNVATFKSFICKLVLIAFNNLVDV
jgi:hypothetical protein